MPQIRSRDHGCFFLLVAGIVMISVGSKENIPGLMYTGIAILSLFGALVLCGCLVVFGLGACFTDALQSLGSSKSPDVAISIGGREEAASAASAALLPPSSAFVIPVSLSWDASLARLEAATRTSEFEAALRELAACVAAHDTGSSSSPKADVLSHGKHAREVHVAEWTPAVAAAFGTLLKSCPEVATPNTVNAEHHASTDPQPVVVDSAAVVAKADAIPASTVASAKKKKNAKNHKDEPHPVDKHSEP